MNFPPSVSVCFPAYNEESSIGGVLAEAHLILSSSGIDYEVLVCDDGSLDRTGAIIGEAAVRYPRFRHLSNPKNLGIRGTFERLYSQASKDFVFLNSTDRQWDTGILLDMLPFTKDFDVIIASRKGRHYGPLRSVVSYVFNIIPAVLFGVRTYDAGAVKLVRRDIIKRFRLVSRSPFSEAERLIRASRAGYRITQYPVDIHRRDSGRSRGVNIRTVLQACADVFRVWIDIRKERDDGPSKVHVV